MKRVVAGTAGHVDHGKTRLLEALTGIDCDRWAEEKARGITIDLGFAHLEATTDDETLQIGFVDVPGHESFLHNALAGLGGIRLLLLVVAADEGPMPQTREHLEICRLLGLPEAVVALTKIDRLDGPESGEPEPPAPASDDALDASIERVRELLDTSPWPDAPIVPVSSTTGSGIDTLRALLIERAAALSLDEGPDESNSDSSPFRLPIDRSFRLQGTGTIVTGTPIAGTVTVGDTLAVAPSASGAPSVRIRGVQVHGTERSAGHTGERLALQVAPHQASGADTSPESLGRGRELLESGAFTTTTSLIVAFEPSRLEDDLGSKSRSTDLTEAWQPVRCHLYAASVTGRARRVGPVGSPGLVELRLEAPVVAVRDDRLILRRPSPARLLGGGRVLDPRWSRARGADRRDALGRLGSERDALLLWTEQAGLAGATAETLRARLGQAHDTTASRLDALVASGSLLRLEPNRFVHPKGVEALFRQSTEVLRAHHRDDRLSTGMPRAAWVAAVLPGRARALSAIYLGWLVAAKAVVVDGDRLTLPGRGGPKLTAEEGRLRDRLRREVVEGGLRPPSPKELARRLDAKPQIVEGVIRLLLQRGEMVKLPSGLLVSSDAIETLRRDLAGTGWTTFSVPQFKDHFGLSRKWAIPLLEHLDSLGDTRRVGDVRQRVGALEPTS